jgi:hypothetical protein
MTVAGLPLRLRTLFAGCAAGAVLGLAALAPSAGAIPIRGFEMKEAQDGSAVQISALAYSPPGAAGCGAYVTVAIYPMDGSATPLRSRSRRINVCRGNSGNYTVGLIQLTFNSINLRGGTYYIGIAASQMVNGVRSQHVIVRTRSI